MTNARTLFATIAAILFSVGVTTAAAPRGKTDLTKLSADVQTFDTDSKAKAFVPAKMPPHLKLISDDLKTVSLSLTNSDPDLADLRQTLVSLGNAIVVMGQKIENPGNSSVRTETDLEEIQRHTSVLATGWIVPAIDLRHAGKSLSSVGRSLSNYSAKDTGLELENLAKSLASLALSLSTVPKPRPFGTTYASVPYVFFVSSGAIFQSPYIVSYDKNANTAKLEKAGNSTAGFLEFSYFDRFVLRHVADDERGERARDRWARQESTAKIGSGANSEPAVEFLWPFLHFPDIEWHIGFVFANGTSSSNYSASTIAGSGDYYTDTSIGLPIARCSSPGLVQQASIEFSGGAVTDKNFLSVHPNFFAGLGYQCSFKVPALSETNAAFILARAGYGLLDVPKLGSGTNLDVEVERTLPKFDIAWAPSIGTYFAVPLPLLNSYLTLRANIYFRDHPSPWNITASFTIPLAEIGKIFPSSQK